MYGPRTSRLDTITSPCCPHPTSSFVSRIVISVSHTTMSSVLYTRGRGCACCRNYYFLELFAGWTWGSRARICSLFIDRNQCSRLWSFFEHEVIVRWICVSSYNALNDATSFLTESLLDDSLERLGYYLPPKRAMIRLRLGLSSSPTPGISVVLCHIWHAKTHQ